MPRQSSFKWNENNTKRLKQVVSDFNKKLTRVKNENPKLKTSLPEKVKYSELKSIITTKKDFNVNIRRLERFQNKNATDLITVPETRENIKITRWQYNELNKVVEQVNKNRENRKNKLDKIQLKSGGKPLNYTRGQLGMGSYTENELKPTKAFSSTMENYDVKARYKSLLIQSSDSYFRKRDLILRENYIKTLKQEFGNDSKPIIEKIESMSIDKFLQTFYSEDSLFEFAYKTEHYDDYLNHNRRVWGLKPKETDLTIKYDGMKKSK